MTFETSSTQPETNQEMNLLNTELAKAKVYIQKELMIIDGINIENDPQAIKHWIETQAKNFGDYLESYQNLAASWNQDSTLEEGGELNEVQREILAILIKARVNNFSQSEAA